MIAIGSGISKDDLKLLASNGDVLMVDGNNTDKIAEEASDKTKAGKLYFNLLLYDMTNI